MKFDKSQDSSWNALVVYVNSQCILAGSKLQKKFFCLTFCLSCTKLFANKFTQSKIAKVIIQKGLDNSDSDTDSIIVVQLL